MVSNRLLAGAEKVGSVVAAPHSYSEVRDQIAGARRLMADLTKLWSQMSNETRFLLANELGHTWLQAALRMKGYRTTNAQGHRLALYNLIPELAPGAAGSQEVLTRTHNSRNKNTYESAIQVTDSLVDDLFKGVKSVAEEVEFEFKNYTKAHAPAPPSPEQVASKPKKAEKFGKVKTASKGSDKKPAARSKETPGRVKPVARAKPPTGRKAEVDVKAARLPVRASALLQTEKPKSKTARAPH